MELNSSSVCVATIHNEQDHHNKSTNDKLAPLYATVIPSNARKPKQQQQLAQQQKSESTNKQQLVCGNKALVKSEQQRILKNHIDNNECESSSTGESDDETVELWSHEIPVWIKGEQRWISGVTDQTTCMDLIEALLIDEGVIKATSSDNNNNHEKSIYPTRVNEYVIIERWRRVEQVLDPRTKILKIWTAWGEEQAEVKFTLKRRSDSHHSSTSTTHQSLSQIFAGDRDSGRESPTGSINSAIVRRRRHRASKSTMAWMTHGQTIHPKSQKSNIERLMKLILEQGEVIQQQLSKLRERDLEISILEDERHKTREKEHGKNYLLEAYLKGLPDVDDKQEENAAGNSDSGVHTETAASPVVNDDETALLPTIEDDEKTTADINGASTSAASNMATMKKYRRSKREHELMLEHQSTKEFSSAIREEWKLDEITMMPTTLAGTSSSSSKAAAAMIGNNNGDKGAVVAATTSSSTIDNEVAAQIDILEKLIVLNKHLQREEELCVRLSAKIKRYEADVSGLSETQVKDSLKRVNEQLEVTQAEIAKMECELKVSDVELESKTEILKKLYDELDVESDDDDDGDDCDVVDSSVGIQERKSSEVKTSSSFVSAPDVVPSTSSIPKALPPTKTEKFLSLKDDELSMSREYLAENIYNISKIILKSNGHPPQSLMKSINQQTSASNVTAADFIRHTPDSSSSLLLSNANSLHQSALLQSQRQLHQQQQQQQQIYQMPNGTTTTEKRAIHMTTPASNLQHFNLNRNNDATAATVMNPLNQQHFIHHQQQQQQQQVRASMNYLETINQRIQKINHLDMMDINSLNNPIIQANQFKLGPKKLLINTPNMNGNLNSVNNIYKRNLILQPNSSPSSTANYGIDMLDASQLGTLV